MSGAGVLGAVGLACAKSASDGPVIGLALGSGAARGWAHLGVLQELAREGVTPQIITGCSIGAFVGALVVLFIYHLIIKNRAPSA